MADNTPFLASTDPASPKIADKEVTHSGEAARVQLITLVDVTGSEGAYTLHHLSGYHAAATATAVASGTTDAQIIAATPGLRLMGYTIKESAGSPAEAEAILRHGTTTGDTPLDFLTLGARESVREWYGPQGKAAPNGIFLDRVSGSTQITIFTVVVA